MELIRPVQIDMANHVDYCIYWITYLRQKGTNWKQIGKRVQVNVCRKVALLIL